MEFTHVDGKDKGKVLLYAISTCIWCKKTKKLLHDLGIAYDYVDVDLLPDDDIKIVRKEVLKWKKRVAYPVIVINNEKCIPSFEPDKIKEAFT